MFRQPGLHSPCHANNSRSPWMPLNHAGGCGCTCPAAKFLALLASRTPDLLHLIRPLPLFCSLSLCTWHNLTLHSPVIKLAMHRQLLASCWHHYTTKMFKTSWRHIKPSFDQMRILSRNLCPHSQAGMVHLDNLLTCDSAESQVCWRAVTNLANHTTCWENS